MESHIFEGVAPAIYIDFITGLRRGHDRVSWNSCFPPTQRALACSKPPAQSGIEENPLRDNG
jgi:hypothetical protein